MEGNVEVTIYRWSVLITVKRLTPTQYENARAVAHLIGDDSDERVLDARVAATADDGSQHRAALAAEVRGWARDLVAGFFRGHPETWPEWETISPDNKQSIMEWFDGWLHNPDAWLDIRVHVE